MSHLTEAGRRAISDIAARYGLSEDAVEAMARSVQQGGGTMAQFNIPELGGSGQWMAGGMTMVGDMFNSGLQARVAGLCSELASAMSAEAFFLPPPRGIGASAWWPPELGSPGASGGQNQMRYAYFPNARRVAVDPGDGRPVVVLDALDHQIGGFSQQQSGYGDPYQGVSFSSQLGQYPLVSLPLAPDYHPSRDRAPTQTSEPEPEPTVAEPPAPLQQPVMAPAPESAPTPAPEPSEPAAAEPRPVEQQPAEPVHAPGDGPAIIALIEKLAALHKGGILTDEEFSRKKAELLSRL